MEFQEVTEFDVYLDIDGAVEEDEDTIQSGNETDCALPLDRGEQSVQLPWQPHVNGHESGNRGGNTALSSARKPVSVPAESGHSARSHDSDITDNEEVDVDTPFDGKLFGQTHLKSEPSKHQTLLSTLLSYTSMPSSFATVSKNTAIPKKSAVAKKSTTQRKSESSVTVNKTHFLQKGHQQSTQNIPYHPPVLQQQVKKNISNIARKSTSKQTRPSSSVASTMPSKAKTGNVLQVKFGPGKYPAKSALQTSFKNRFLSKPSAVLKKPVSASKKGFAQGVPKAIALSNKSPVGIPMSASQGGKSMFPCDERSGDRIACPECSIVVKTYCLRSHLKTVHNLPMKICKKCKITFTDINLFSEHYALHLQEQEDNFSDVEISPKLHGIGGTSKAKDSSRVEAARKPVFIKKLPTSTITRDPTSGEDSSVSSDAAFPLHPRPMQSEQSVKKRLSSPLSVGPSPKYRKLTDEFHSVTEKIAFPKLPPKPRKPSFHPKKKRSFFPATKKTVSESVEGSANQLFEVNKTLTLKPKLPAKPRKPFSPSKMRELCPASRNDKPLHGKKVADAIPRERRSSTASLQSDLSICESSETSRSSSSLYKDNLKTASRQQTSVSSSEEMPRLKKQRVDGDAGAPVTRKYCGKATVSLVSLETASRPYDCKKCLAAFHVALQCPRSFRLHSQSKPCSCPSCPAAFTTLEQLKTHQETQCFSVPIKNDDSLHASLRRHRSPSFSHPRELVQNVPSKSPGGLFECHRCKETFPYRSVLLRHIPYHSYQYSCGVCKKAFVKKVDLLDHLQIMHDGRMLLRCKYCEVKFEDIAEFDSHIVTHKDGTVVPCTVCGEEFTSSRKMQVHLTVTHGVSQNPHVCQVCGKWFNQAKLLSIHTRVAHKNANAEAGRLCKVCGRRFKQAKLLSAHMKIAHKTSWPIVTKFLSCRYCHKVFHNKQGLASHCKLRHGVSLTTALSAKSTKVVKNVPGPSSDPPVSSPSEKARIPSSAVQTERSLPVLDRKSKTCHMCGKRYSTRKVLVAHYRNTHKVDPSGLKPIKCQICNKVLYSIQGLKVHYRVRHKRRMPKQDAVGQEPKPAVTSDNKVMATSGLRPAVTSAPAPRPVVSAGPKPAVTLGPKPTAGPSTKGRCRCGRCGKFFLYSWSLFRHQRLYHRESLKPKNTSTKKPNPALEQKSQLQVKMIKTPFFFQKRQPWACPVCGKRFVLRKTMRMHVKSEHPNSFDDQRFGGRKCTKCKKTFPSKTKLNIHLKNCPKGRVQKQGMWKSNGRHGIFKCTLCERTFNWKQNLIRHMQVHHKLTKEVLDYNMTHQKLAESDRSFASVWKFYLCEICKVCFTVKRSLARHKKRRHEGISGSFQCRHRFCNRIFAKHDALVQHIKTVHPGMPVHLCYGCGLGFETSGELFRHTCSGRKQSGASASTSQCDDTEYTPENSLGSFSLEQECRYRCMTCDMAFLTAREWTRHMQEHTENMDEISDKAQQEQVVEAADKIRLSIFDIMSGSIFSCKFCQAIFKDESEMNHHICEQPAARNTSPKKGKRKRKNRNLEPVKCTVCLKFFSPLSIKRHMMRIHSLPMKICSTCNIVFTDLERYRRHMENHNQPESNLEAATAVAQPVEDEPGEESFTFFICQVCGGLFSDAESLESHACSGEDGGEMAMDQNEFEASPQTYSLEDHQSTSSETDTSIISKCSRMVGQSAGSADIDTNMAFEGERESLIMETPGEDAGDDGFGTGIVIESVSGGVTMDSDSFMYRKEGTESNTDTSMEFQNEGMAGKELSTSFSISSEEKLKHGPQETFSTAPSSSELLPDKSGMEEMTPDLQEQVQSCTSPFVSVRIPSFYGQPEAVISMENRGALIDIKKEKDICNEINETIYSGVHKENNTEMGENAQHKETQDRTRETIQCKETDIRTSEFDHCELDHERSKTGPYEAGSTEMNGTGQCDETDTATTYGDAFHSQYMYTETADRSGVASSEDQVENHGLGSHTQFVQVQQKIGEENQEFHGQYN